MAVVLVVALSWAAVTICVRGGQWSPVFRGGGSVCRCGVVVLAVLLAVAVVVWRLRVWSSSSCVRLHEVVACCRVRGRRGRRGEGLVHTS